MASIDSMTFDQAAYNPGDLINLTIDYAPDTPSVVPTTFNATASITDASGNIVASSSAPFVGQLGARHAIAQVGHANRFGHPDRAVSRRWQQGGASFWRTDRDGAVQVTSSAQGMTIVSHRRAQERYWHGR